MSNPEYPNHPNIYDACMAKARALGGFKATPWLHLSDAVESGSVTPMEAYDALALGYLPEVLTVRESRYKHLL